MKAAIIVQARMTSTRLPGKVLLEVLGKPLLEFQTERLARCRRAAEVVIATTVNASDEPIVAFCRARGLRCFRGPEDDVLTRYQGAAAACGADIVVRATSDCPLIDPEVVDAVIGKLVSGPGLDYVSNILERSYPRGLDCEAFPAAVLEAAYREAAPGPEREHVTPFIYGHPDRFRLGNVRHPIDLSRHRWTVDTPEDFRLIRNLLEAVYPVEPDFRLADCLRALAAHPDWEAINAHVEQKKTFG